MARRISLEIVGDASSLERAFRRSSRSARGFNRDMDRTFRGVIAGSGVFKSLGRSVAFASTTFLGGVGLSAAIRSSLEAAQDQIKTNKALDAQFRASGKNVQNYKARIDEAVGGLVDLGIQDDETIKAFTVLFRSTNDVTESINRLQLVADIAAARHVDLQKAALLVGKVETGNTGILRRYGVQVGKTATVQEALTAATQAFAGQAKAAVTPQARFAAVLDQTQETIGNALLPVLTRYLERFTEWLDKTNRSGELQRRLNETMESLARILPKVEHGISQIAAAVLKVKDAFGGWDNALKALGLLVVLTKLRRLQGKPGGRSGGGGSGLAGIGALLLGLPGIATIAAAGLVNASDKMSNAVNTVYNNIARFDHAVLKFFHVDLPTGLDKSKAATINLAKAIATVGNALSGLGGGAIGAVGAAIATAAPGGAIAGTRGAPQRKEFKLTTQLQLAKAQAALTEGTADDVRVAKQIVAFINKLRAARRLAPKALISALGELAGALDTIRSATHDAAEKTAEAAKKHAEALKRASEKQQQAAAEAAAKIREATENARTLIGDLFQGPVLAPTEQQRKEQLGVPGIDIGRLTADVTAQTTQFLEFMKDLATIRKRGGSKQLVADLRRQGLESAPVAATIAGAKPADFRKLLGALEVRERAIRKAATRPLRVFVTVNLDGKTVAANVTAHQQRNARHQGRQRRGRNGGQALGLA